MYRQGSTQGILAAHASEVMGCDEVRGIRASSRRPSWTNLRSAGTARQRLGTYAAAVLASGNADARADGIDWTRRKPG